MHFIYDVLGLKVVKTDSESVVKVNAKARKSSRTLFAPRSVGASQTIYPVNSTNCITRPLD